MANCHVLNINGLPHTQYEGSFFFLWWDWRLNSGFRAYKAGPLLLKLYLQSIFLQLFWR
jgi:hypothetical protein